MHEVNPADQSITFSFFGFFRALKSFKYGTLIVSALYVFERLSLLGKRRVRGHFGTSY
jgi:hypothetical protein